MPAEHLWDTSGVSNLQPESLSHLNRAMAEDGIFIIAHAMNECVPAHRHAFFELCYVLEGDVINCVEGEDLYMAAGSLCIMNESSVHSLEVSQRDSVIVNVCIKRGLFEDGFLKAFFEDENAIARFLRGETNYNRLILNDLDGHILGHGIRALLHEYQRAGGREDFEVDARVLMILAQALRVESFSYYGINERMMQILDYINANARDVSCAAIACEVGLSEAYLSQYVKKHMGRSLNSIIRDIRLEHAVELLRTTEMPVDAVANAVGYSSYSHFNRIFVEKYKTTPAEGRNFGANH